MITATPLNTIKGQVPSWKIQQVVQDAAKAKATEVRDVKKTGRKVDAIQASSVKAAVDQGLIVQKEIKAEGPLPEGANKYAKFDEVTQYKVLSTYEVGGSNPNPLDFELTHKPLYAVVTYCEVQLPNTPFGIAPPKNPPCKTGSDLSGVVILERDLGSVRVPPIVAFISSVLLFGLGLLALHWRERDEQEAEKAKQGSLTPVPAT
jgi:hypothetical protein